MPHESVHARQGKPSHGRPVLFSRGAPFVLLLFLMIGYAGCGPGSVRHAEGKREGPVVILGDSLGAGYEMKRGDGFVEVLGQRLGITITNLSKSGLTTAGARPRVKEEVLPLEPSLVLLQVGGNDALQKVDPATTRENLAAMIEELQSAGVPVLLLGVRGGLLHDDYKGIFETLASTYQTGFVADLLEGILTHPELKIDSIHPNAKGHQLIADHVEPELRRLLGMIGALP